MPAKALTLLELRNSMSTRMQRGAATLLWNSSNLMQLLRFLPHNDLLYNWTQEGALPTSGGRDLNEDFDDDDSKEGTPDSPKVTGLAILGGKIRTDRLLQMMRGDAVRTRRIARKITAAARQFNRLLIKGDRSALGPGKKRKKEFDGLYKRIPNSRVLAAGRTRPTWKKVCELLDSVDGPNSEKTLLMPRTMRRLLSEDVVESAPGGSLMDVGRQLTTFEGARVAEVDKDESENEIMPFNEGEDEDECSIVCVRFGGETPEDGVQAVSGLPETISHTGPHDNGIHLIDYIHMVVGIEIFSGYSAARMSGFVATDPG